MRYLFIEELPGWRELQVIEFKVTVQIGIQMPGKAHMCCPMCCGVPLLRDLPLLHPIDAVMSTGPFTPVSLSGLSAGECIYTWLSQDWRGSALE